jgi:hypothetical protein
MRWLIAGMIVCFTVTLGAAGSGSDKQEGQSVLRDSLFWVEFPDGSRLSIRASLPSLQEQHTAAVTVDCHPKGRGGKEPTIWHTELAKMEYMPATKYYYALVKATKDRAFIFCLWDGQYLTLDKQTGKVLTEGKGDDPLKDYNDLVPLKLQLRLPSIGGPMTQQKSDEMDRMEAEDQKILRNSMQHPH